MTPDDDEPEQVYRPGRVVPVFAVTGGRTRSTGADLPMESLVRAAQWTPWPGMQAEYRAILELAEEPVSLAEIGAHLGVPVGVARVLVGDLAAAGYVSLYEPEPTDDDGGPPVAVLELLLESLRAR
jgi:hypothetical protein